MKGAVMRVNAATVPSLKELDAAELAWGNGATEPVPADGLALVRVLKGLPIHRESGPLRAYLLLDCWDANPLAEQLQKEFPEAAQGRCLVPEPLYEGREGQAPCLVPMPQDLWPIADADTLVQSMAQDWLALWLQAALEEARKRVVRQHFCAVLVSGCSIELVARHLARLGFQYVPPEAGTSSGEARLFRYQDPRVIQRVWPTLSQVQQDTWLGVVQEWWTLMQPWGPLGLQSLAAGTEQAMPGWFKVRRQPGREEGGQPRPLALSRLMNAEQWHAAHASPWGAQSWTALASANVPIEQQPDGMAMSAAIAHGQRLGLDGQDLEAFIELSWLLPGEEGATSAHARPWEDPLNRHALERALQQMRSQPGVRFAAAWLNVKP